MEEKLKSLVIKTIYTTETFQKKIGYSWVMLAATALLGEYGIKDLNLIYQLALCIEENTDLYNTDENYQNIINKFKELRDEHINKPFNLND